MKIVYAAPLIPKTTLLFHLYITITFPRPFLSAIVGSCRIYRNNSYALATATFRDDTRIADTYACEGNPESNVHIISVYEGPVHTRPASPGDVHVRVTGGDQGPITIVFSSYEPVRWLVSVDEGIMINKFVLVRKFILYIPLYLRIYNYIMFLYDYHFTTAVKQISILAYFVC